MTRFEDLDVNTLTNVIGNREDIHIDISEQVTRFSELTDPDFSRSREVPPTPSVLMPDALAQDILQRKADIRGKYDMLVVTVYALGGKIFYKYIGNGTYRAHVLWP